jgi:hypothetical protein
MLDGYVQTECLIMDGGDPQKNDQNTRLWRNKVPRPPPILATWLMRCWSSTVAFVVISLLKSPSGPELQHEPSELPAGGTKSEYTGRRSARKLDLLQNAANASGFFVSCALSSKIAWVLCNRYCNQAVIELCNSMLCLSTIPSAAECYQGS